MQGHGGNLPSGGNELGCEFTVKSFSVGLASGCASESEPPPAKCKVACLLLERGIHNFELLKVTPGWGDAQTDSTGKVTARFCTAAASLCIYTSRSSATGLHKCDCDHIGSHNFAVLMQLSFSNTQDPV